MRLWIFLVCIFSFSISMAQTETPNTSPEKTKTHTKGAVPAVIYHVGPKQYLLKDIKANTVPKEAWDRFIMGPEARKFDIPSFRRGFYGDEFPLDSLFYGDKSMSKGVEPWMIAISVKEECRVPERVYDRDYGDLSDPEFAAWLSAKPRGGFESLEKMNQECVQSDASGKKIFDASLDLVDETESPCQKILGDYFSEKKFSVIRDHHGIPTLSEKSWYIRDRECISSIKGTSPELLKALNSHEMWHEEFRDAGLPTLLVVTSAIVKDLVENYEFDEQRENIEKLKAQIDERLNAPHKDDEIGDRTILDTIKRILDTSITISEEDLPELALRLHTFQVDLLTQLGADIDSDSINRDTFYPPVQLLQKSLEPIEKK